MLVVMFCFKRRTFYPASYVVWNNIFKMSTASINMSMPKDSLFLFTSILFKHSKHASSGHGKCTSATSMPFDVPTSSQSEFGRGPFQSIP